MQALQEQTQPCPYCGESITLLIDCTAGEESYVEDCAVCCQAILVEVDASGGEAQVSLSQENG